MTLPLRKSLASLLLPALIAISAGPASAEERAPEAEEPAAAIAERLRHDDPEERLKAAKDALGCASAKLTSPLIKLLGDKSPVVRIAAVEALGARTDKAGRKRAAGTLAGRLSRLEKKPQDRDELMATLEALRELAQPGPIKGLISGIKTDSDNDVVQARLMAVAAVPSKDAVERLITFLSKGRRGGLKAQRQAAVKALQYATGIRNPGGPGKEPDRWRAWWRENEKDFDFEAVAAARAEATRRAQEQRDKAKERKERKKKNKKNKQGGKKGKKKPKDNGSDA